MNSNLAESNFAIRFNEYVLSLKNDVGTATKHWDRYFSCKPLRKKI